MWCQWQQYTNQFHLHYVHILVNNSLKCILYPLYKGPSFKRGYFLNIKAVERWSGKNIHIKRMVYLAFKGACQHTILSDICPYQLDSGHFVQLWRMCVELNVVRCHAAKQHRRTFDVCECKLYCFVFHFCTLFDFMTFLA